MHKENNTKINKNFKLNKKKHKKEEKNSLTKFLSKKSSLKHKNKNKKSKKQNIVKNITEKITTQKIKKKLISKKESQKIKVIKDSYEISNQKEPQKNIKNKEKLENKDYENKIKKEENQKIEEEEELKREIEQKRKSKKLKTIINENIEYFSHIGGTCQCTDCTCGKCKCDNKKIKQMINNKNTFKTSNQIDFIIKNPIVNDPIKYERYNFKPKNSNLNSKSRIDFKKREIPQIKFEKISRDYFCILKNLKNKNNKETTFKRDFKNNFEKRIPNMYFKPKRHSSVVKLPTLNNSLKNLKLKQRLFKSKKRNIIDPTQKYKNPLGPFGNLYDTSSYQDEFIKNDINKYFEKKNPNSIHKKIHSFSFKGKFKNSSQKYGLIKENKCPVFYKRKDSNTFQRKRKQGFHKLSILN